MVNFQLLEIQILPPLHFRTDFPGYRGLQYVHNVLVFWVISNFFKCQKPNYSHHGLPVNSHANFIYSFPTLKIILIPTMTRSNCFWFISFIAHTGHRPPHARVTILVCDIDLLVVMHTSKNLLALLNHSFWGVHIAGRKQSFTSWGLNITGRNWAFSSAVEKLSRHCPGTEYQHKWGHTSNLLCRIQKNSPCQRCIKIHWDITFQWGERRRHQMARRMLGDFHINLQSLLSHIRITVSTGNCPRNYPTIWPYTDHPVWTAGGDWYARAACTGNQAIYQGTKNTSFISQT